MRKKLIYLINEERWTIRAAAEELGIKLCTAKHILYLYRKEGKIYRKKGGNFSAVKNADDVVDDREPGNVIYVPYPFYIFCFCSGEQMPINLEHFKQI